MRQFVTRRRLSRGRGRIGIALVSVLYFLIVCALVTTAVLFAQRTASGNAHSGAGGAELLGAAEASAFHALAAWDGAARARQAIGSTVAFAEPTSAGTSGTVYVTRLTMRIFSILAEARDNTGAAARRVGLLVRLPLRIDQPRAALVSAVNVTIGPDVRFIQDSAACGDTGTAAVVLAPSASITIESASHAAPPTLVRSSVAEDSSLFLRVGDAWWDDLVRRADIRLAPGAHALPQPVATRDQCGSDDTNWGEPSSLTAACAHRTPIVYASGDLTIDGGRGQGVLLVDGRLTIAGSFLFSGQIVVRRGIETLTDNIAISGLVSAWRASTNVSATQATTSDVVLTHATTLRYSGCDARYGIASWLQPRIVRERAWSELF